MVFRHSNNLELVNNDFSLRSRDMFFTNPDFKYPTNLKMNANINRMKELSAREKYDFKKKLEELRKLKGQHTELISLYIPPDKQISDVSSHLTDEYSQSSNIKSKATRKNVLSAIESIQSKLKYFKNPPENGVVFFVGAISIGDQSEMVSHVIQPPLPISTYLYRCDSSFYLEPLEEMLVEREIYGLLLVDRKECTIGFLKGKRIELATYMTSRVPGKHKKGGWSQQRFERLIEIAANEWFKKCGEKASEIFQNELKGILIGGPGATKREFVNGGYLHHEIQNKIVGTFDTGYTDEYGLKELVNNASKEMKLLGVAKEKELIQRFLQEIRKDGLAVYGEKQVRKALEMGAIAILLISEDLGQYRVSLKCPSCGYRERKTTKRKRKEIECPKCSNLLDIADEIDLIDELSDLAENTSAEAELISQESEEGETLLKAFGGIAGILRYKIS